MNKDDNKIGLLVGEMSLEYGGFMKKMTDHRRETGKRLDHNTLTKDLGKKYVIKCLMLEIDAKEFIAEALQSGFERWMFE